MTSVARAHSSDAAAQYVAARPSACPHPPQAGPATSVRCGSRAHRTARRMPALALEPYVPVDTHLANLGSHSAFLVLGEAGVREFLDEERRRLGALFPDGMVEEEYRVDLLVATRA